MYQNFTQRFEMQIPQENTYTGLTILENKLQEFLKKHFILSSDNLVEIHDFIKNDEELERIIYDLPKIISRNFPHDELIMDILNENDETELDITIITNLNGDIASNKQDILNNELYDNYNWDSVDKILVSVDFTWQK